jgi:hypothetical protein
MEPVGRSHLIGRLPNAGEQPAANLPAPCIDTFYQFRGDKQSMWLISRKFAASKLVNDSLCGCPGRWRAAQRCVRLERLLWIRRLSS